VAVVPGVTGVDWRLVSAVSTSVEKSIVLLTGVVELLGAVTVLSADLETARNSSQTFVSGIHCVIEVGQRKVWVNNVF
jgi:hypothetical protein